ncbi:endonuclease MutS2 [Thermoflavimicrobium daqui]|uniref:DNA mismatch repair protein n=1 Tax=Thermoflavimicrobium daqui TaxID=2137476 RepID=A0A364K5I5_9BACL|nr:endonuclease MutS2 [Thermoflavimicrobium daqui]RAL24541.1 DNA mismatch repair protein [Thermoflavimicrobium daqui]
MEEKTERKLEFDIVKLELSKYTLSDEAKVYIRDLKPQYHRETIEQQIQETTEAKIILKKGQVPIHSLSGVAQMLDQFNKGMVFKPSQFEVILRFIESGNRLKEFMKDKALLPPIISSYAENISELKELREAIINSIRHGVIDNYASKELAKIRKQITTHEQRIKDTVQKIVHSPAKRKYLQEYFVSQRNGRYVIPVKKEYRNKIAGQVLDSSASGSTVYIEPKGIQKDQQKILELQGHEFIEEQRILSMLTGMAEVYEQEIRSNAEILAHYDFVFAKAKYSEFLNAQPVEIVDTPILDLKKARHPLLHQEAKPLDIGLGETFRTLVITGPNTGGKTVTLKTAGLLTVMALSGLHIPASKDSRVGLFEHVFIDIGDDQDIKQSLSTFSSQMKNVIDILNKVNQYSLVLLDELGAGTDPAEGMGLAIAILDQLNERGALTIATTHYNDIKSYAYRHPDFENARMEFDLETLMPLYQLTIGKPGESQAFQVARMLGLDPKIIKKAHETTYGKNQQMKANKS